MEYHTKTTNKKPFKIVKESDDPLCQRVSLGGTKKEGYYLVFRGDIEDIEDMIHEADIAIRKSRDKFITQNN